MTSPVVSEPVKGAANGLCNRTACQRPLCGEPVHQFMDGIFTGGPRLHYCEECAADFDLWDHRSGDAIRIQRKAKESVVPALTDGDGEPFGPEYYAGLLAHAWECLRAGTPFTLNSDGAIAVIQKAASDRLSVTRLEAQASAYKERVEALEAVLLKFADAYEDQGSLCGTVSEVVEAETAMDTAYVETRALLNGADR